MSSPDPRFYSHHTNMSVTWHSSDVDDNVGVDDDVDNYDDDDYDVDVDDGVDDVDDDDSNNITVTRESIPDCRSQVTKKNFNNFSKESRTAQRKGLEKSTTVIPWCIASQATFCSCCIIIIIIIIIIINLVWLQVEPHQAEYGQHVCSSRSTTIRQSAIVRAPGLHLDSELSNSQPSCMLRASTSTVSCPTVSHRACSGPPPRQWAVYETSCRQGGDMMFHDMMLLPPNDDCDRYVDA